MKLKCLRALGIDISPNPETVVKSLTDDDMKMKLSNTLQDNTDVEFEEWKRVDVEGKKKMKIVK